MSTEFSLEAERLVATDATTGVLIWEGCPEGRPVARLVTIAGSEEAVVLLRYDSGPLDGEFANILRCRRDGTIAWRAEVPVRGNDTYVDLSRLEDGRLSPHSWSGYQVTIDPDTGRIVTKEFVK